MIFAQTLWRAKDEFNEVNEKLKVIKERLLQDDEYVEQNEIYKSLRLEHGDLIKEFADKTDQLITNGASDV